MIRQILSSARAWLANEEPEQNASAIEQKQPQERAYAAGKATLADYQWAGSDGSADAVIRNDLATIRAKARDADENTPYVPAYLAELCSNVLGPEGMTLQPQVKEYDPKAGAMVLDKVANSKILEGWEAWKAKGVCEMTGTLTFHDCEVSELSAAARDGEGLVRHIRDADNDFGYKIQLIESDALDINLNTTSPRGNIIVMGVEMDQWRKPLFYWLLKKHPGDYFLPSLPASGDKWEVVPAADIIHLRKPRRINESRSVSWLSAIINEIDQLAQYAKAEVTAARVSACQGGVLQADSNEPGTGMGALAKFLNRVGAKVWELLPAQVRIIPPGWKFQAISPTHPNGNFGEFLKAALRGIASCLRVSYMALSGDLTAASYSSSRTGMLTERDNYKMLQRWFIDHFEKPIFSEWLRMALTYNAINLPQTKFKKFNVPYFQARTWQWIDPARDLRAIETELKLCITSPQQVIAERYAHTTFPDVLREIKEAREQAAAHGISWPGEESIALPTTGDGEMVVAGTAEEAAANAENVQDTALNGIQVEALLTIINNVATGMIPKSTAIAVIKASFPLIDPSLVAEMLAGIKEGGQKPAENEPAPTNEEVPESPNRTLSLHPPTHPRANGATSNGGHS